MIEFDIVVGPAGDVRFIYDDALLPLMEEGRADIKRASRVEPDGLALWWADLGPVGGPRLGPFKIQSKALEAERAWLLARGIPFPEER